MPGLRVAKQENILNQLGKTPLLNNNPAAEPFAYFCPAGRGNDVPLIYENLRTATSFAGTSILRKTWMNSPGTCTG